MSYFGELFGAPEQRGVSGRELLEMAETYGTSSGKSLTGVKVTPKRALGSAGVLQAVLLIMGAVSQLPLILYERSGRDRERATAHRLYSTLHDQPNPEMTASSFVRQQYLSKLLHGNRYAEIEFDGAGRALYLWPLHPDCVTPQRLYKRLGGGITADPSQATPEDRRRGGTIVYEVTTAQQGQVYLEAERMFHVPDHLTWNGVEGISRIKAALEPVAIALATQETAAALLGNGATPGGLIKRPAEAPPLTPTGARNRIAAWEASHGGPRRSGRVALLQEGEEWVQVTLSPHDAQLVEMLNLGTLWAAQIFNTPPYFLGAAQTNEPYSNVESEWQRLVTQTLLPHLVDDQQEIRRRLLDPSERDAYFAEYELKALLKADAATRATVLKTYIEAGLMKPNDAAATENLPAIPPEEGGDTYRVPRNFGAASVVLSERSTPAQQQPPPQPAAPTDKPAK